MKLRKSKHKFEFSLSSLCLLSLIEDFSLYLLSNTENKHGLRMGIPYRNFSRVLQREDLVALLFQTDPEAHRKGKLNANTLCQSVSAGCLKMFKWIFLVLDCLQPVGCFLQMIMTTHICITLGQKHNRLHSLWLKLCIFLSCGRWLNWRAKASRRSCYIVPFKGN